MSGFGVIFDMDGVLVDSYRAHYESWRDTAASFGLRMSEEEFRSTFGRLSREIITRLWPGRFTEEQIVAFDARKEEAYREGLRRHFPEKDGASDLIGMLHDAGFRMAIGSSGPAENVELARQCLCNSRHIAATVSGREVRNGKPDPEVFLTAAGKMMLASRQCAVIEDAPVGVEAARRAGMTAIAITGTASRESLLRDAHLVVDSLRELDPEVIRELIVTSRPASEA